MNAIPKTRKQRQENMNTTTDNSEMQNRKEGGKNGKRGKMSAAFQKKRARKAVRGLECVSSPRRVVRRSLIPRGPDTLGLNSA